MCGPYLKGWVVGQSYHGRFVGVPIRRQFFGFSRFALAKFLRLLASDVAGKGI
jgi:hypothetical protein